MGVWTGRRPPRPGAWKHATKRLVGRDGRRWKSEGGSSAEKELRSQPRNWRQPRAWWLERQLC
eukprot:10064824-Lingulodinium_polyedra.AAC.1